MPSPTTPKDQEFIRPLRRKYVHVGATGPSDENKMRDLTDEENEEFMGNYVKFEEYADSNSPVKGRYWTQDQLDNIWKGCESETTMELEMSENFARNPSYYREVYCSVCKKNFHANEFRWVEDGLDVGS